MYTHRNIMINKVGGNAGSTAKNYRVSIPVDMIHALGITEEDRGVLLTCENGVITIKKSKENRQRYLQKSYGIFTYLQTGRKSGWKNKRRNEKCRCFRKE